MKNKLYKSNSDKKISGVCGGIAEHLNVDSTIIRLLWVLLSFMYGSGIFIYIVCALIIPDKPEERENEN